MTINNILNGKKYTSLLLTLLLPLARRERVKLVPRFVGDYEASSLL